MWTMQISILPRIASSVRIELLKDSIHFHLFLENAAKDINQAYKCSIIKA